MQEGVVMLAVLLSRYELEEIPHADPVLPVLVATMEPAGLRVRCVSLPPDDSDASPHATATETAV